MRVVPVVVGALDADSLPPLLRVKRRVDWRTTEGQAELLAWISAAPPRAPRGKTTELRLRLQSKDGQIEARWVDRDEDSHLFDLPMAALNATPTPAG